MGRILMFVVSLGVLGYIAYLQVYNHKSAATGVSAPKQQLDNVHRAADRIEQQGQQKVDDIMNKGKELEK